MQVLTWGGEEGEGERKKGRRGEGEGGVSKE